MVKKNILIVEDNAVLSMYTATVVRKLGHAVAGQVQTGLQAITANLTHRPDLVIISMQLPGRLTAVQIVDEIRTRHATPVIYVSTDPAALTREQDKGEALTEFLGKPVSFQEYQSAITRLSSAASTGHQREIRVSSP